MLGILRTLLPLLGSTVLLLVWVVLILVVVVRWVISQFQAEKAAVAVVTLLAFLLLPAAAGLLGHLFFSSEPKAPAGPTSAFSELVDRMIENSGKKEEKQEDPGGAQEDPGEG